MSKDKKKEQSDKKNIKLIKSERRFVPGERWGVTIGLALYDIIMANLSFFLAMWIRFDLRFSVIPKEYSIPYVKFIPIYSIVVLMIYYFFKLYNSVWRFASYRELTNIVFATFVTGTFHIVAITLLFKRMPLSYYMMGPVLQGIFTAAVRFSYRYILLMNDIREQTRTESTKGRVMLIGAGTAGHMILRDINHGKDSRDRVCCIIDDNPNKWGRYIDGVPIVGGREDILLNVEEYNIEKIFLAVSNISAAEKRNILNLCSETGCELKTLPGILDIVKGKISIESIRKVEVEDLLGRDSIQVNLDEIFLYLRGKVILVTGGGGSIGSELCRQIAAHKPKQLIIVDIYENNAYDIQQELKEKYPELNLEVLIASVRDSRTINQIFEKYKPDVVYHAAAHKHVPLMETSPNEAIKNNTIGTYKTAYAAVMNGCKRFVLISTDKAVNPTNIMGASKRLCEMIVQSFDKLIKEGRADEIQPMYVHKENDEYDGMEKLPEDGRTFNTEFVAVRFGNVLGSNGSVVPLFKKQIEKGGPVTVTHPDIIRYFMTIPEAVSLVLQAGTYAKGGEIFVLDMGEPMKIDTLARNLIKLSGYKPDVDIKVEYTGLRPGEKLYEEKLMEEEGMKTTPNKLIHVGKPIPLETDVFMEQLRQLMYVSYENDSDIRAFVESMVETYHPESVEN